MLREWVYRDHYHPDWKEEDLPHWMLHAGKREKEVLKHTI